MLFITHDLSLVEGTADRVAVMKDGVIVEEGSTADVLENPQHEYTKKLLGYLKYSRNKGHDHRSEPERTVPLWKSGTCTRPMRQTGKNAEQ